MLHGCTHAVFLSLLCPLDNGDAICHWERAVIGYMRMLHGRTHAVSLLLLCPLDNGDAICHWERAVVGSMRMLHCARTHAVFLMRCARFAIFLFAYGHAIYI